MQVDALTGASNTKATIPKSPYRPEIDGLRAFAVIAVIINHFNKDLLPSGYLGVDIFFVISGYVITSSLANHRSESFGDFFLGFYARRVKRLLPALVVFVAIAFPVSSLFISPEPALDFNSYARTGISSLFGLSNLYLFKQSTDYFASSTEYNVFTHTWSLGVEEQFYIVFPFLIWLSGFGRITAKGERNLFWTTLILSIGSIIGFVYLYPTHQSAAYFLMPPRIWELGAGCLIFLALQHRRRLLGRMKELPPSLVAGALVAALFIPLSHAVLATIAVVSLTLCLLACLRPEKGGYGLFTHPQIVYLGLISYSLYLWHWGVLCISRWTIGIHWWSWPLQVGLMLVLAIGSYRYVETPLRKAEWSAKRWRTISLGAGAAEATAGTILAIARAPNFSLYTGQKPTINSEGVSSLTTPYSIQDTAWSGDRCVLSSNSQVGKIIPTTGCTLGNFSGARRRVLVIGNSFSAAFVHSFDKLVTDDNYAVTITSSWGASPVREITNRSTWDKANNYYWSNTIPSLTEKLSKGDWVFLINDMAGFSPKQQSTQSKQTLATLKTGLLRLATELSEREIHVAVLHGNPFAREANCKPLNAAKQWFNGLSNKCSLPDRSQSLLRRNPLNGILRELERQDHIKVIDLFDIFCPLKECTYNSANGSILYRDEFSHPSVEAAKLSSANIRKALTSSPNNQL